MKWITLIILLGILTLCYQDKDNVKIEEVPKEAVIVKSPPTARMKLTKYISSKFKISRPQALKIVTEAEKHSSKKGFPKLSDTLAIIAIESRFKAYAVSPTNAVGLMQIVYKRSSTDISKNIKDGTTLLKTYYRLTKNKDHTIQAYNVGIGAFYNGARSTEYLETFKKHKQKFEEIT